MHKEKMQGGKKKVHPNKKKKPERGNEWDLNNPKRRKKEPTHNWATPKKWDIKQR